MKIAIAGATGVVGRHAAEAAAAAGHAVVPLTRSLGVDVTSGEGLAARLEGVDAVIDCLNIATTRKRPSVEFFTTTSDNLLAAEEQAGVPHHVLLSIVGIDQVPFGYYDGKVAQEQRVRDSGRPATIVRASQFHEFAEQMLERGKVGPVVVAPKMLSAPVAAQEVGAALAELAAGAPHPETLEMGGPEQLEISALVARVGRARGGIKVVAARLPGAAGKAMTAGHLVPSSPWRVGTQTWDKWFAERER